MHMAINMAMVFGRLIASEIIPIRPAIVEKFFQQIFSASRRRRWEARNGIKG